MRLNGHIGSVMGYNFVKPRLSPNYVKIDMAIGKRKKKKKTKKNKKKQKKTKKSKKRDGAPIFSLCTPTLKKIETDFLFTY